VNPNLLAGLNLNLLLAGPHAKDDGQNQYGRCQNGRRTNDPERPFGQASPAGVTHSGNINRSCQIAHVHNWRNTEFAMAGTYNYRNILPIINNRNFLPE
jgi:hypothetical protein